MKNATEMRPDCNTADHFVDTTKMVPLSPEQLREMDGKPIWIEHDEDPKYNHVWMIWNNEIGMRHNLAGYNIFWRAYAYPHAHINREAWTNACIYDLYRLLLAVDDGIQKKDLTILRPPSRPGAPENGIPFRKKLSQLEDEYDELLRQACSAAERKMKANCKKEE